MHRRTWATFENTIQCKMRTRLQLVLMCALQRQSLHVLKLQSIDIRTLHFNLRLQLRPAQQSAAGKCGDKTHKFTPRHTRRRTHNREAMYRVGPSSCWPLLLLLLLPTLLLLLLPSAIGELLRLVE